MTRYERFKAILGADLPRLPWLGCVAGISLAHIMDKEGALGLKLALWFVCLLTIVCAVWVVAAVIDGAKRAGLAIERIDRGGDK